MMEGVGALVTLQLEDDSPILAMPWIITFGPLDEDDAWEPVVCGPYEREHAIALAEEVVGDQELMAVVEPLMSLVSASDIQAEIATARAEAVLENDLDLADDHHDHDHHDHDHEHGHDHVEEVTGPPPTPDEIRAGMARIARRLAEST